MVSNLKTFDLQLRTPLHLERVTVSDNFPPLEYILDNWLSTADVAAMHDLGAANVRDLCERGTLRCKQIAGRWFVDPASAREYVPGLRGRPRKNPKSE